MTRRRAARVPRQHEGQLFTEADLSGQVRVFLSIEDRRLKNRHDFRFARLCARNRLHQQEAAGLAGRQPGGHRGRLEPCALLQPPERGGIDPRIDAADNRQLHRSDAQVPCSHFNQLGHTGIAGHRERAQVDRLLPTGEQRRSLDQRRRPSPPIDGFIETIRLDLLPSSDLLPTPVLSAISSNPVCARSA